MAQVAEEVLVVAPRMAPHHVETITSNKLIREGEYSEINSASPSEKNKYAANEVYQEYFPRSSSKNRTTTVIIAVLALVIVSLLVSMIFIWMYHPKHLESSNNDRQKVTASNTSSSTQTKNRKEPVFFRVVGSSTKYTHWWFEKGEKFSYWLMQKMNGKFKFKSSTFIVVQQPGVYKIYAQIAVYTKDKNSRARVMVMRNKNILSQIVVENCTEICKGYNDKIATLNKGDYLYLQAGNGGKFIMESEHAYFGAFSI